MNKIWIDTIDKKSLNNFLFHLEFAIDFVFNLNKY